MVQGWAGAGRVGRGDQRAGQEVGRGTGMRVKKGSKRCGVGRGQRHAGQEVGRGTGWSWVGSPWELGYGLAGQFRGWGRLAVGATTPNPLQRRCRRGSAGCLRLLPSALPISPAPKAFPPSSPCIIRVGLVPLPLAHSAQRSCCVCVALRRNRSRSLANCFCTSDLSASAASAHSLTPCVNSLSF